MKNKYLISIYSLALLLALPTLIFVTRASAATPGCYRASGSADRVTITSTECPNADIQEDVNKGACYISFNQSTNFSSQLCSQIETGLNDNSGSAESSGGASGSSVEPTPVNTDCNGDDLDRDNCQIINWLVIGINFLSAIAGVVIVASIMISGFQYMTAQDNAGQIEKAKSRIIITLLALAVFIFMYALLNYLVPGGVL
jgi:hypothetical protein